MGLMGVLPFFVLVFLTAVSAVRIWIWVWRTASPFSPAVPIAMVLTAGIAHATFEDWMFAVGYYMCVFFWSLAFALVDLRSFYAAEPSRSRVTVAPRAWRSAPAALHVSR